MGQAFDPWDRMIEHAQERVLQAGISGGDVHEKIDQATIIMATVGWGVNEIKESNRELAQTLRNGNGSRKELIKRHGAGAGIGAGAVAIVQMIREFMS